MVRQCVIGCSVGLACYFKNQGEKCVWTSDGFSDLNHLSSAMKIHAASKEHINNAMAQRTFGKSRIDECLDHAREVARTQHNLRVKKNREGMKTLIELVCCWFARA